MNKREIGSRYEEAAAAFLQSQGFRILEKNFRCRQGEIDLVCQEGKELVFTEVTAPVFLILQRRLNAPAYRL